MEYVTALRWLHIVGAAVLLGTGAGIAYFMVQANRTRDTAIVAHTSSAVVVADYVFTASAVVLQPITGVLLAIQIGWPLTQGWIVATGVLYAVAGFCWLPVLWIQRRMRDLARKAAERSEPLPSQYHALYRMWFLLGIPAFFSVLCIVWLIVARPSFDVFE